MPASGPVWTLLTNTSNVIFDTGSADIVLPKKGCKTCGDATLFDPAKSSTYSPKPGDEVQPSYGTAGATQPLAKPATADGHMNSDTVTIGGVSLKNQPIFLADRYPTDIGEQPLGPNIDGIFGLGPPGVSLLGQDIGKNLSTTFWGLVESGQLPEPVFGLALSSGNGTTGQLTLGGVDKSRYKGQLEKVPFNATVSGGFGQWFMNTPTFYVNGDAVKDSDSGKSFPAGISIVDSGTAYIQAPDKQTAKDMYAAISPEIKMLDKLGTWGAPCKVMEKLRPKLTFTVGAGDRLLNMTVPRDAFNVGEHPQHPGQCQGVILHAAKPIEIASVWVLGGPLLKGYYTAWDGKNFELGVAELKDAQTEGEGTSKGGDGKDDDSKSGDGKKGDEKTDDEETGDATSLLPRYWLAASAVGLLCSLW